MKIAEQRLQGTDYKITVFAWYVEYRLQSKEYRGGWCIKEEGDVLTEQEPHIRIHIFQGPPPCPAQSALLYQWFTYVHCINIRYKQLCKSRSELIYKKDQAHMPTVYQRISHRPWFFTNVAAIQFFSPLLDWTNTHALWQEYELIWSWP